MRQKNSLFGRCPPVHKREQAKDRKGEIGDPMGDYHAAELRLKTTKNPIQMQKRHQTEQYPGNNKESFFHGVASIVFYLFKTIL
jgi:hypothetical protein